MNAIRHIARKELYHILRDVRSLIIVFVMPIMMTFLYGYAINLDVEHIVLAIVDHDQSTESHELVDRFYNSTYFSRPTAEIDPSDPQALLRKAEAAGVLVIKNGFAEALSRRDDFEIGVLIDGSDVGLAAAVQSYSSMIVRDFMLDRLPEGITIPQVNISRQVFYNPDLKSSHFLVPGLVGVILLLISTLLTSVTIAREKETGTMEQLLTAPVKPSEILIGKLIPYIFIAFADGILILLFAKFLFGVPFVGSKLLLVLFGLIYVATALSIGILISSLVKTQQVAMMLAQTTTMLPAVMLSGFIFAIKNMPIPLQAVSYVIPARYFISIIRGIMLKGATFGLVVLEGGALLAIMLLLLILATKKFRTGAA